MEVRELRWNIEVAGDEPATDGEDHRSVVAKADLLVLAKHLKSGEVMEMGRPKVSFSHGQKILLI